MSSLAPCMAAFAISAWMCVWMDECDKCSKVLEKYKPIYLYQTCYCYTDVGVDEVCIFLQKYRPVFYNLSGK